MTIIVSNLKKDIRGEEVLLTADVSVEGRKEICVMTQFGTLPSLIDGEARFDAFALMLLAPAMRMRLPLVIEGEVDELLLFNLQGTVQELIRLSLQETRTIYVSAAPRLPQKQKTLGITATAFSGGIDSSYVLLKCRSPQGVPSDFRTGLLMHHDVGAFSERSHYEDSLKHVLVEAERYGLPLAGVRCDMPKWNSPWPFIRVHSLCNVAAALSLGDHFTNFLYASGHSISEALQSKSFKKIDVLNHLLFPALETHEHSFRVFGSSKTRTQKMVELLEDGSMTHSLSVCSRMRRRNPEFLNCGTCGKCLRLIMLAEVVGKKEQLREGFDLAAFERERSRCELKLVKGATLSSNAESDRQLTGYLSAHGYHFPWPVKLWLDRLAA
jgi:hypothetical protein